MAAGKWKLYNIAKLRNHDGSYDLDSHTFKMAIFLVTSNANDLTKVNLADLTNEHAAVSGYVTGGVTLTTNQLVQTLGVTKFTSDNPVYSAAGGDLVGRMLVIYDDTHASNGLVAVCLMDTTVGASVTVPDGNDLTVRVPTGGYFDIGGANTD